MIRDNSVLQAFNIVHRGSTFSKTVTCFQSDLIKHRGYPLMLGIPYIKLLPLDLTDKAAHDLFLADLFPALSMRFPLLSPL